MGCSKFLCVSSGCHHQTTQTGGLKQQTFIFSQLWRLQRSRCWQVYISFWGFSWLVGSGHLAVCPHDLCACVGGEREPSGVSSNKDIKSCWIRAPSLWPHYDELTSSVINLNYFLRGPMSRYSHSGGYAFNIWILRDANIKSITPCSGCCGQRYMNHVTFQKVKYSELQNIDTSDPKGFRSEIMHI